MSRSVTIRSLGCVCLAAAFLFRVAPARAGTCSGLSGGPGDIDGDGHVAIGDDCDDSDPAVWARTAAVGQVKLAKAAGGGSALITWNPVSDTGGSSASVTYEIVRSRVPSNFATHPTATCLDPGGTELQFTDPAVPPPGGIFYYVVRGRNACGPGDPGTRSNGTPRDVKDCAFSVVCSDANACTDDSASNGVCTHTPVAPKILNPPSSIGVCTGDLARYSVQTATRAGMHYAWTKNGLPVGGDSPILELPPATAADNHHQVTVTVHDACGSVNAESAFLTVFSDPAACDGGLNGPPAPNGASDPQTSKSWLPSNFRGPKGMPGARVDLHSGELEYAETDMEIRGRGFDFAFTRYYRSREWQSTAMGVGWTHAYARHALAQNGGVVVFNPMSGSDFFAPSIDGGPCYTSPTGVFEELCAQADGTLRMTFPDGLIWTFHALDASSASGLIVQARDRYDNLMSFAYDSGGKLTTITDTLGRAITLTYNTRNLIDSVTDFTGASVHYQYYDGTDGGGEIDDLKSVTTTPVVGTPTGNDFPQGRTTTYTYSNGFALGPENHNLLSVTGPDGKTFARFSYSLTDNQFDHAFDRLSTAVVLDGTSSRSEMFTYVALTPDPSNDFAVSKTIVKDATNHRSDYFYNDQAQLVRVVDFTGVLPDANTFASDLDNLPGPPDNPADPPQLETSIHYDGNALITEVKLPSLATISRVYDSGSASVGKRGDLLSETFQPGPLGGDQTEIHRSWTYATPYGTDWAARGDVHIVHPPGTPPGTWRRISDVRIVHPPGTPPGTWRKMHPKLYQEGVDPFASVGAKSASLVVSGSPGGSARTATVTASASPGGSASRRVSDVHIVHPPGTPPGAWKMRPKQHQEEVDPFAGMSARSASVMISASPGGSLTSRRVSDVHIVHPPGTPPGAWRVDAQPPGIERCDEDSGGDACAKVSAITSRFGKCVATDSGDFKYRLGGDPDDDGDGEPTDDAKVSPITSRFGKCVATDSGDFKYRLGGDPDDDGDDVPTDDARRRGGDCDYGDVIITKTQDTSSSFSAFGGTLPSAGFPTSATDENGQTWSFTYDTSGFLTDLLAPTVVTGTLTGAPQTIHHHWDRNPYGQIVAYTNPGNEVSTLDYSSSGAQNGYLRELHIPAGTLSVGVQYTFSARGQLTGVTDPNGHTTTMTLDDDDDVVRVTAPAPLSYQTDFYYDIDGRIVRTDALNVDENGVVRPNHHISSRTDYDRLGNVVRISDEIDASQCAIEEYEYDPVFRIAKVKTGASSAGGPPKLVEEIQYGRVKVRFPWLREDKDANGSAWARQRFDFDADGRVVAMHDGIGPAAMIADTLFTHDGYGRVTKITDAEGNERSLHYDAASHVVSSRLDGELQDGSSGPNVKLAACTMLYDEVGRQVECQCDHLRRASGAPIGDGTNLCLGYYDEESRLVRTQDDNGHGTDYAYEPGGRLHLVTDAMGNTTQMDYDPASNVLQATETDAAGAGGPPASRSTHYEYDAIGRLTAAVDPAGSRSEGRYDRVGLAVRVWENGNVGRFVRDGLGRLVQTQYDMTDTGDGSGNVTSTLTSSQTWDDRGNVTSTTDAEGNTWTYGYDGGDRLNQKTAADGKHTTLIWSPRSNLVSATDPNGSVSTLTYDKLGRMTDASIVRAPGVAGTTAEHFAYDGAGSLVSASDDDSLVTRAYDSNGQMLSETQQMSGGPPRTMTIERDSVGNPTSIVYPSGLSVSYGLDALDRTQVVFADGAFVALYDYLGAERMSRIVSGNMVGTDYTYDSSGRLEQKTVSGSGGSVYVAQVNWDNVRLASRTEPVFGTTTTYRYDSLDRLDESKTTSSGLDAERIYTLSAMGDRVLVIGGHDAGPYTRDPSLPEPADFQMHQYTSTPSGTRTYDSNGNTLTMNGGTPSAFAMTYDYAGNTVTAGGQSFGQDAFGRYLLRAGIPLRSWTYGPGGAIEQYDGSTLQATFVRGAGGELLRMIEDADINGNGVLDTYTYHTDDLGNVRALTDQTGATVEMYNYDDYGNPSFYANPATPIPASLTGNPFLYRSMMWDPATKLYRRIRGGAYDSVTGRYLSALKAEVAVAQGMSGRVAPLHGGLEGARQLTAMGTYTPLPPSVSTPAATIHWTLVVRVDRIEMK